MYLYIGPIPKRESKILTLIITHNKFARPLSTLTRYRVANCIP